MHLSIWSLKLHGSILLFALFGALVMMLISAVISILVYPFKTPSFKGKVGEFRVRHSSLSKLPPNIYHQFHDVFLKTTGGTTQIDHLLISRFGVFVVETKNWKGWIFGNVTDSHWTQVIYGEKYRLVNPIRQNYKHVRAVAKALGMPERNIHPLVVLVGRCSFRTMPPPEVVRGGGLAPYVKSFNEPVLSESEVLRLVDEIEIKRIPATRASRRKHVDNLKKRSDPKAHWLCSRCGKPMVLRTVKHGVRAGQEFWGCSGYPQCRYTRNLE